MKFAWIICVLIIVFDSVQMQSFERDDEVETNSQSDSKMKVTDKTQKEGQVSAKIKNNTNRLSLKKQVPTSGDARAKNNPTPNIQRKDAQRGPSFVPTTRRPLMKTRKFTTKPHTVYHVHSNEQRLYSRRRQSNSNKRLRHQNDKNSNKIKSNEPESDNDRFKDFKDSDELEQNKNTAPRGRVRSYIPAASEKFVVRTLPSKNNTIDNIIRSKAKLAIEESLQKFKNGRPAMKEKDIIADSPSSSENRSIKPVILQNAKKNTAKINKSNNPVQSTTERISSTITTEKLDESIIIKTETPKEIITTTPKFDYSVTKSEKSLVDSTIITTEKSIIPATESVEVVTDNKIVYLDEKTVSNKPIATTDIVTSTEISPPNNVDSLLTIKEIEQLLTRRKRANNIIEEEPVATTSYGLELNRRESPINIDFSYNNIHV